MIQKHGAGDGYIRRCCGRQARCETRLRVPSRLRESAGPGTACRATAVLQRESPGIIAELLPNALRIDGQEAGEAHYEATFAAGDVWSARGSNASRRAELGA